jgi:hypothetical protein
MGGQTRHFVMLPGHEEHLSIGNALKMAKNKEASAMKASIITPMKDGVPWVHSSSAPFMANPSIFARRCSSDACTKGKVQRRQSFITLRDRIACKGFPGWAPYFLQFSCISRHQRVCGVRLVCQGSCLSKNLFVKSVCFQVGNTT